MSCPICDRPTDPDVRPFCSKRCADIDLARWLTGSYAIPAAAEEQGDDAPVESFGEGPEKPH